jgi:hypothetical protein
VASAQVGSWALDLDGGPLGSLSGSTYLDGALKAADVAPMNDRYPILAIGSNAAPAQLRHKFGVAPGVSDVVPLTRAEVRGLGVGHSAHVSKAGYIPYVPITGSQETGQHLFVLWLDLKQTTCIDRTEPNYHPTVIPSEDFPMTLESGETLNQYALYQGRWGALRLTPTGPPLPATSQDEVYGKLAELAWFEYLVPESRNGVEAAIQALGADGRRRSGMRNAFAREGLTVNDGLPEYDGRPIPYGEM